MLQLEIGYYTESEKNILVCLKHFKKQKDNLGQAAVYGILGIIYFKSEQYQKSIQYYNMAYEIYDKFHQIQEKITCLIGIGNNFIKLNQFDEACEIFLECSAICSDNKDIYNLLDCLGNLVTLYEKQENWDIVYELYKKTLKAFKELDDVKGIITSYFNLGIIKKKEGDFEQAITYFKEGTNKAIESSYAESILKGLSYIGEVMVYQYRMSEAKDVYIKALSIANEVSAKNSILQIRILLNSLGLSEDDINIELNHYINRAKNSPD
jgi:tetratricopeptide (TPR) repeat protein